MPHGCWIDLYETPDLSGQRRRLFGPRELDAFVWRRFDATDVVSVHAGPRASVRLRHREGPDRLVAPGEKATGIVVGDVHFLIVTVAGAVAADDVDARPHHAHPREAVHRDVDDRPAAPRRRRQPKRMDADDQTTERVSDGDDSP